MAIRKGKREGSRKNIFWVSAKRIARKKNYVVAGGEG